MRELMRARDELIEQIKHEKNQAEHLGALEVLAEQAARRMETFLGQKNKSSKRCARSSEKTPG